MIRDLGMGEFLKQQQSRHSCSRCGEPISVHNNKCFACDPVISWRE
jgi:hypothetical protein